MSESLTYRSGGGPVGQPPALPGTTSRPRWGAAEPEKSQLGRSRCAGALGRQRTGNTSNVAVLTEARGKDL